MAEEETKAFSFALNRLSSKSTQQVPGPQSTRYLCLHAVFQTAMCELSPFYGQSNACLLHRQFPVCSTEHETVASSNSSFYLSRCQRARWGGLETIHDKKSQQGQHIKKELLHFFEPSCVPETVLCSGTACLILMTTLR